MGVHFAKTVLGSILAGILFAACSSKSTDNAQALAPKGNTNAADADRRTFQVRGVIQELKPAEKEIVIKHEEIPNYMAAMTMPFEVKNTNEFRGLNTNDQVTFTMVVTEKEGWIENLHKVGVDTNSIPNKERPAVRLVRDVEELKIGDKMPDYSFTNSFGKKISLSQFSGQAYAFTFIFTRCPFPNFCPRMSSNFSEAFKQLQARTNGPTNWHLFSISFDPDFDTPDRLRDYSAMYHPDPNKWDWLTGAMIDIDAITEQVGLAFAFDNGTFNHNLRTAVVDKNGYLRKMFVGNEWKPEELVQEIVAGAEGKPIPKEG